MSAYWKETKFFNSLSAWWGDQDVVDSDYRVIWAEESGKAKMLDKKIEEIKSMTHAYLHSDEGCMHMSTVAVRAADMSKGLARFLALTSWKEDEKEKALGTKQKRCAAKKDPQFSLGKDNLTQSMLRGLKGWNEGDWIQQSYMNVVKARQLTYGIFDLHGNSSLEEKDKVLKVSVDAYRKSRCTGVDTSSYHFGIAEGKDSNRVIATTEAVMLAHWRLAVYQLEEVVKMKIPKCSKLQQYFE